MRAGVEIYKIFLVSYGFQVVTWGWSALELAIQHCSHRRAMHHQDSPLKIKIFIYFLNKKKYFALWFSANNLNLLDWAWWAWCSGCEALAAECRTSSAVQWWRLRLKPRAVFMIFYESMKTEGQYRKQTSAKCWCDSARPPPRDRF